MKSPKTARLAALVILTFTSIAFSIGLSSCSVSPSGPAAVGASHGALGSDNMCDYYYKKTAGWTYAFSNVENIYNSDGTVTTLTGAPDTVRTLGYCCVAPNGDSLYQIAITYRVTAYYAGRNTIDMYYLPPHSDNNNASSGGFVDNGAQVSGMKIMLKKPRPVSTDTILAGVIGRVRTLADDFTNTAASYVWQTDTLWASEHNDTVLIWERFPGSTVLSRSRCIFTRDFAKHVDWKYDLIWNTTMVHVDSADMSLTVPAGTFAHVAKMDVSTNDDVMGNLPITEKKYFAFGVGFTKEYDVWRVTTDGQHFTKEDFTRSLVSLTYH